MEKIAKAVTVYCPDSKDSYFCVKFDADAAGKSKFPFILKGFSVIGNTYGKDVSNETAISYFDSLSTRRHKAQEKGKPESLLPAIKTACNGDGYV